MSEQVIQVPLSKELLDKLCVRIRVMEEDNEGGQPFEFWDSVEMMDLGTEVLMAAEKTGSWTPPPEEEEEEE